MQKREFAPFVHEFDSSFLVIGEHQYFKGYCVLHHKECIADITDLDVDKQKIFFEELMLAAKVVKKFFKADRINYSCLGNVVSHLHFHIFPRYRDELNKAEKKDPWTNSNDFKNYQLSEEQYLLLASSLGKEFDSEIVNNQTH